MAVLSLNRIGLIKESLGDVSVQPILVMEAVFPSSIRTRSTGTHLDPQKTRQGLVVIGYDVDERGFTTNHTVVSNDGPQAYVNATLEAVEQFRYAPRFVNGKPVKVTGLKHGINFLIRE